MCAWWVLCTWFDVLKIDVITRFQSSIACISPKIKTSAMGRRDHAKRQIKNKTNDKQHQTTQELEGLVDKLLRIGTVTTQNLTKALELQEEITTTTDKIREIESHRPGTNSVDNVRCDSDTLARFTNWLDVNGAKFEGCGIADFPGYELGLKAEIDIAQDSLIIAVPRSLMLTVETAGSSELGPLIEKDQILKNMPNVTLAMHLLLEKFKEESFYKPYIDILPKTYSTVLYFTTDELKELQGSATLESALKQIKSIARQYSYFHKLIHASKDPACNILKTNFTYDQYR